MTTVVTPLSGLVLQAPTTGNQRLTEPQTITELSRTLEAAIEGCARLLERQGHHVVARNEKPTQVSGRTKLFVVLY